VSAPLAVSDFRQPLPTVALLLTDVMGHFRQISRFWLPVDFRFAPKADVRQ
jgi:hypothetical protein